jgi:glucose-6-phosphate 1-dehydrogenase
MRTVFIIFGSTGDLAKRKIFPALYNIYDSQSSENIDIIATGRKEITNF